MRKLYKKLMRIKPKRDRQNEKLVPMTFYNLTTNTVEEYDVNIVEDIDYIQRFNLGHIEQIPELALEIYADVYDKEGNSVFDKIYFLSYEGNDDIITTLQEIRNMLTKEMKDYKTEKETSYLRSIIENKIIEKAIERRKRGKLTD